MLLLPSFVCVCVCTLPPHKTFIYSNDLEEVARVPGRLALETGDRLSFLPDFLSPVFISHRDPTVVAFVL